MAVLHGTYTCKCHHVFDVRVTQAADDHRIIKAGDNEEALSEVTALWLGSCLFQASWEGHQLVIQRASSYSGQSQASKSQARSSLRAGLRVMETRFARESFALSHGVSTLI